MRRIATVIAAILLSVPRAQAGGWEDSSAYLSFEKPSFGAETYPWLESAKSLVYATLSERETGESLLREHEARGTRTVQGRLPYLGPMKAVGLREADSSGLWGLLSGARDRTFKKGVSSATPSSLRDGYRFSLTGIPSFTGSKDEVGAGVAADPVRYGLVLRGIEPSKERTDLASVERGPSAYYLGPVPEARLIYDIGEIRDETKTYVSTSYSEEAGTDVPPLSGKIVPRGLPGPGGLPDTVFTLESAGGYYHGEAKVFGKKDKKADIHRLRTPAFYGRNVMEERDGSLKTKKTVLENLHRTNFTALNFEILRTEKKKRAVIVVRGVPGNLEVSGTAGDALRLSPQRIIYELKVDTRF